MAISDGTVLRLVAAMLFPDNVVAQMVFHLVATDLAGGNDPADVVQDLEEYATNVLTEVISDVADVMATDEVVVYEYDPVDEDFDEVGRAAWTVTFTGALEMLPHGVAGVVNLLTTDPDVQGRKFIPGITEGRQEDGVWIPAAVLNFADFGAEMTAPFTSAVLGNDYQPSVWSPTHLTAYGCTGAGSVSSIPGYQRRRKPGVGI